MRKHTLSRGTLTAALLGHERVGQTWEPDDPPHLLVDIRHFISYPETNSLRTPDFSLQSINLLQHFFFPSKGAQEVASPLTLGELATPTGDFLAGLLFYTDGVLTGKEKNNLFGFCPVEISDLVMMPIPFPS